jgi:hypothetical protein
VTASITLMPAWQIDSVSPHGLLMKIGAFLAREISAAG